MSLTPELQSLVIQTTPNASGKCSCLGPLLKESDSLEIGVGAWSSAFSKPFLAVFLPWVWRLREVKAFAQGHSQAVAKGAFGPGPSGLPTSSAASLWTGSFLQFYFPLDAQIRAMAASARLSFLPLPIPSLKGQVPPSLQWACPFMVLLFQNVAKFINSPFPETRNNLCRVQCGGRAGSFVPGLDLSPGLDPVSSGVGWVPASPWASVSPPPEPRN